MEHPLILFVISGIAAFLSLGAGIVGAIKRRRSQKELHSIRQSSPQVEENEQTSGTIPAVGTSPTVQPAQSWWEVDEASAYPIETSGNQQAHYQTPAIGGFLYSGSGEIYVLPRSHVLRIAKDSKVESPATTADSLYQAGLNAADRRDLKQAIALFQASLAAERQNKTGEQKSQSETRNNVEIVERCLLDEKFDFRTVEGIAKETGISKEEIAEILENSLFVRKALVNGRYGSRLYTHKRNSIKPKETLTFIQQTASKFYVGRL